MTTKSSLMQCADHSPGEESLRELFTVASWMWVLVVGCLLGQLSGSTKECLIVLNKYSGDSIINNRKEK